MLIRLHGYALDELVQRAEIRDDEFDPDLAPLFDAFDGKSLNVTRENGVAVCEALTEISNCCDAWAEYSAKHKDYLEARAQRAACQGLGTASTKIYRAFDYFRPA